MQHIERPASFRTDMVSYLFIILFVYSGTSKLLDIENFAVQIGRSPVLSIIGEYRFLTALVLPLIEIAIAIALLFDSFRLAGLWFATALMIIFTFYVGAMVFFAPFLPCKCGGALEALGWEEHLIFNSSFVILGIWAIRKHSLESRRTQGVGKSTPL